PRFTRDRRAASTDTVRPSLAEVLGKLQLLKDRRSARAALTSTGYLPFHFGSAPADFEAVGGWRFPMETARSRRHDCAQLRRRARGSI
ncbi:MAG: hypothetical protein ABI298_00665, partial [Acidimicrobiales bacterium]